MSADQVLQTVFDKLFLGVVLGAVLIGVGYVVNRRLERFKIAEQFHLEQLRERNRRLDDILIIMLDFDAAADELIVASGKFIENCKAGGLKRLLKLGGGDIPPASQRLDASETLIRRKVETGRAWLGDKLCELCLRYLDLVVERIKEETIVGTHDTDMIEKLDSQAHTVRRELVEEIRRPP